MKKVFLSSTCYDLNDLRSIAPSVVSSCGLEALLNERPNFPVKSRLSSYDVCLKAVEECDIFVLVIDRRYGGLYNNEGISITHKEYRRAKELGKPQIVFVRMRIWDERLHYKKNPNMSLSFADDSRIFNLIDEVHHSTTDNWIIQFIDAIDFAKKIKEKIELVLSDPIYKKECHKALSQIWKKKEKVEKRIKTIKKTFLKYSPCAFAQDFSLGLCYLKQIHKMYYIPKFCKQNIFKFEVLNIHTKPLDKDVLFLKGINALNKKILISGYDFTKRQKMHFNELAGTKNLKKIEFFFTDAIKPGERRKFELKFNWPGPGTKIPHHWHFIPLDYFCFKVGIEIVFSPQFKLKDIQVFKGQEPLMERIKFKKRLGCEGKNKCLRVEVDYPPIDEALDFRYVFDK